jgi:hypothetical protein
MTKGLAMAVLTLTLAGCSEKWEGFVYPDKSNLQRSQTVGLYPSLEECRLAARRALADLFNDPQLTRGDYECGLNCDDGRKYGGVKVCKKTER